MKLALLGHGAMGKVVATCAHAAGHSVGTIITVKDAKASAADLAGRLKHHDAAIDFSHPDAVMRHVDAAMSAGVPIVVGTTGWHDREAGVRKAVEDAGGAMVYGANFSIGVNLFYRLVEKAGELFGGLADYDAFIQEEHHARKKDAPSGTAREMQRLLHATLHRDVPVTSTRAGHIPGTHQVGFDSEADQITLIHTARSRDGFAAGALLAARWIGGRRGAYRFAEVLDDIVAAERKRSQ
jgi:4-hydroxy-tetrahydrodipicolinate reductase